MPQDGSSTAGQRVLLWHSTLYVYIDVAVALRRLEVLGDNVTIVEVRDLLAFVRELSRRVPLVDVILDESWHMELYACRETDYQAVSHLRVSTPDYLFELTRCPNAENARWTPYESYNIPAHKAEYCRPVAFPVKPPAGQTVLDASHAVRIMEPESAVTAMAGKRSILLTTHRSPEGIQTHRAWTAPLWDMALYEATSNDVLAVRGEGVFVCFAETTATTSRWTFRKSTDHLCSPGDLDNSFSASSTGGYIRGPEWYLNAAYASLELVGGQDHPDDGWTELALTEAKQLVALGLKDDSSHRYLRALKRNLDVGTKEAILSAVKADRACWLLYVHRYEQMDQEADEAIALCPQFPEPYYTKAHSVLERDKEKSGAWEAALRKVLDVCPGYGPAYFNLAMATNWAQDESGRMAMLEEGARRDPEDAYCAFGIAETHFHAARLDDAEKWACEALKRQPSSIRALRCVFDCYFETHRPANAWAVACILMAKDPLTERWYLFAAKVALDGRLWDLVEFVVEKLERNMPWSPLLKELRGILTDVKKLTSGKDGA